MSDIDCTHNRVNKVIKTNMLITLLSKLSNIIDNILKHGPRLTYIDFNTKVHHLVILEARESHLHIPKAQTANSILIL